MSAAVEPNRLIDVSEWCRITGEGRSSTYQAIQRGEILAVKVGRMTRFSELDAYRRVKERIDAARAASERQSAAACPPTIPLPRIGWNRAARQGPEDVRNGRRTRFR